MPDPSSGAPVGPGGRVAVVTGAASGIGRATAVLLAAAGDSVLCVDRNGTGLDAVVAGIVGTGGSAAALQVDLLDSAAGQQVVATALAHWQRIDVLALVAGVAQLGPAASVTVDEWDRVLDINLRAPFLLAQAALPHLVTTKGAIVAVSSVAGEQGWPYAAVYAASKGGLITVMRSLAIEYGPSGVRINVLAPGSVDTDLAATMHTTGFVYDESLRKRIGGLDGRRANPDEIASLIRFLASSQASFVSGAVLRADGGAFA